METKKQTIIHRLAANFVEINTKWHEIIEEEVTQHNHMVSYMNSPSGRERLQDEQPENVVESVFAIWGDTPTVADPEIPKRVEIPNTETEPEE